MKDKASSGCGLVLIVTVAIIFAYAGGAYFAGVVWRKAAVAHGAGSYVITDPNTGATEFWWKEETSD